MIDEQRLRLSRLQDGELDSADAAALLNACAQDRELRATWERYHLIGHVLRGEAIDPYQRRVADAVAQALPAAQPIPLAAHRRLRHFFSPRSRAFVPVAGASLAAAAAVMAVFVIPSVLQDLSPTEAPVLQQAPLVATPVVDVVRPSKDRWNLDDRPDLAQKLNLFLVTHQESAATMAGSKGMLPYAILVDYDASR